MAHAVVEARADGLVVLLVSGTSSQSISGITECKGDDALAFLEYRVLGRLSSSFLFEGASETSLVCPRWRFEGRVAKLSCSDKVACLRLLAFVTGATFLLLPLRVLVVVLRGVVTR